MSEQNDMTLLPFRAWRYDVSQVGMLSEVICPRAEFLTDQMVDELYRRHPCNSVRVFCNREEPGDSGPYDAKHRAAEFAALWMREGVLLQDPEDSLYACRLYDSPDCSGPPLIHGVVGRLFAPGPCDPAAEEPGEPLLAAPQNCPLPLAEFGRDTSLWNSIDLIAPELISVGGRRTWKVNVVTDEMLQQGLQKEFDLGRAKASPGGECGSGNVVFAYADQEARAVFPCVGMHLPAIVGREEELSARLGEVIGGALKTRQAECSSPEELWEEFQSDPNSNAVLAVDSEGEAVLWDSGADIANPADWLQSAEAKTQLQLARPVDRADVFSALCNVEGHAGRNSILLIFRADAVPLARSGSPPSAVQLPGGALFCD